MGRIRWWSNFLDWLFPVTERIGGDSTVTINIPAELYYKELAVFTATSLISNAISRSEVKTFQGGKAVKGDDYYHLNVSPNKNETSSLFWHRVINKMIREGEALIIETQDGSLYCADSFSRKEERPMLGDLYDGVTIGNLMLDKVWTQDNSYMVRLDDTNVRQLIDGMYDQYGDIMASASTAIKKVNGQKYKLHIEGVKAGDKEFNAEFENYIKTQLKSYLEADTGVYPEFDGYKLEKDPGDRNSSSTGDFINLKKELMATVAAAFHIPESMMTGNITSMKEIVGSFLTFGVDPYADAITEALNKGAGVDNYIKGNYYKVDTGKIQHQNIFDLAVSCMNLISSGVMCIDEIREELDRAPLNTDWSRKHFITKNFEEIERFLTSIQEGGDDGEKS